MYEVYSSITSLQSINVKKKIKMVKTLFYYISAFLNNIISNSQQGSIARFRLTGRGYKSFPFIFTYLFKLGYSYLIFYTLPLTIRLKRKSKKKVFYNIMGLWNSQTMSYLNKIKGLKIPDVYCSKGIFKQHEQFQQKEGKKSFTL
jgi:ribosomal protein L6P/L9E